MENVECVQLLCLLRKVSCSSSFHRTRLKNFLHFIDSSFTHRHLIDLYSLGQDPWPLLKQSLLIIQRSLISDHLIQHRQIVISSQILPGTPFESLRDIPPFPIFASWSSSNRCPLWKSWTNEFCANKKSSSSGWMPYQAGQTQRELNVPSVAIQHLRSMYLSPINIVPTIN